MDELEQLTNILAAGTDLNSEESARAAHLLASPSVDLPIKQSFLVALSEKGETAVEVAAFAATFRDLAVDPELADWAPRAIDVCGTGGDGAHTFNISTAVSFLVAAGGVPVFKHGNRSITSKCGSADLLEALGIKLDASNAVIRASLEELNFCFFFAPAYHPAFKEIMPVRKALAESGRRSIFNLLGPLINPGRPAHQLMGVFSPRWVEPLAGALDALGLKSGLVAHCTPGEGLALDELSCAGSNSVAGFGALSGLSQLPSLDELGLEPCDLDSLKGGDVSTNVQMLHSIFEGSVAEVSKGLIDSILLNAGAALWISGKADDLATGIALARTLIDSGAARDWLARARTFYEQS